MTNALAKLSKAEQWLSEARDDIGELKQIHDVAAAAQAYAKAHASGLAAENYALEIRMLAARRLGELMPAIPQSEGRQEGVSGRTRVRTLDLSIPKQRLAEFRKLAEIATDASIRKTVRSGTDNERKMSWLSAILSLRGQDQEKRADNRARSATPLSEALMHGQFQSADVPDGSVDLIFTDPPYDVEAVGLYADLSEFSARVLRPGGVCLAYSGQFTLPDAMKGLGQNLEYMWVAGIRHTGGELRFRKYHIRNAWKPILVFYKPPLELWWDWFSDMIDGGGKEKDEHEWQQAESEAAHYIAALSPEGGSVLDPMCGSGTSLVAAKKLGRTYLGIDIDAEALQSAARRLNDCE
jgi:site-specific DNA-methyltransferase (adenine-specific)